jgi:hypothetical protein
MIWHYTDRDSAADIRRDNLIRAHPVVIHTQILGGQPVSLAPAVWFTRADDCPTVLAKLTYAGWPLQQPGIIWRFGVDEATVPLDLPAWALPHQYDPKLFQFMLWTAQLAGDNWQDWCLSPTDVPRTAWLAVQSLQPYGWRDEP